MSSSPNTLNGGQQLIRLLSGMPQELRAAASEGFTVLRELPTEKRAPLLELVTKAVMARIPVDLSDAGIEFGLAKQEARALFAATSLVLMAMTESAGATPETFADAAVETKSLNVADREAALELSRTVETQRPQLKHTLAQTKLLSEVLPVLTSVESTVDLRLGFGKSQVESTAPVAVIFLDTDRHGQEITFQVTKPQLEKLIRDLGRVLTRLEQAERWATQQPVRE